MKRAIPVLLALLGLLVVAAQAQPSPEVISFQGRLADANGQPVADGAYQLQFHLYDQPSGGTLQWSETQVVTTRDGVFTALLGSVSPLGGLSFEEGYYVALGVNGSAELGPRTALAAVPYALSAQRLEASALEAGSNVTITRQNDGALRIEAAQGGTGGGLTRVSTDATLAGEGTSGNPLGLADDAVQAGSNVTVRRQNDGAFVVSSTGGSGLSRVATDATLAGEGTSGNPLSLADGAVTGMKIAEGALEAGSNVTITRQHDGVLEIASTGGGFSLPYAGKVSSKDPALSIENNGSGGGIHVASGGHGVAIGSASQDGILVGHAGQHGLRVGEATTNGLQVDQAGFNGVLVQTAGQHGLRIGETTSNGIQIDQAGDHGVLVQAAGQHGLRIGEATSNGIQIDQAGNNGVFINSARRFGLNVGDAVRGVDINTTSSDGLLVRNAGTNGLRILEASVNGLQIDQASNNGLQVGQATFDGLQVQAAGRHGIRVFDAASNGLQIDQANNDGVFITSAGRFGLNVVNAVRGVDINTTSSDGLLVRNAGGHGLRILDAPSNASDGIHVESAGRYGIQASGTLAAGQFNGDVQVTGILSKGGGSFKIDHPLDPAGRYLAHSFVESPDMMNVYNGNAVLDARGEALVELPAYFEALNRDFRYQLTAIGAPGPNLYVGEEIQGNRFKIAGGAPGVKVSWQVTGIRQDAWAEENRIVVEEAKPAEEQGYYLHPEALGLPIERGLTARAAARRQPPGGRH